VRQLVQRSEVMMLVTGERDERSAGRPMLPLFLPNDPSIYFLTHQGSRKIEQIAARPQVTLTTSGAGCYFFVVGLAHVSREPDLVRDLWHPTYRAWFPAGKDDSEAAVVRVVVERVDYWEPPRSSVVRIVQALKAIVTRRPVDTPMKTIDGL
jgi:general stress protein 26